MGDIADILAFNIKRLREIKNWRQADLAEAMGVSLGTVQGYEGRRRWPERPFVLAMAKALNVDETELFKPENVQSEMQEILELLSLWERAPHSRRDAVLKILRNVEKVQASKEKA